MVEMKKYPFVSRSKEVLAHDSTRDGSTSNSNDIAGASHIRSKQTDDNALELKSK